MAEAWLKEEFLAPGMVLVEQGGRSGQLYVLKQGAFEVERDGKHVTTLNAAGSVIGEMSVLLDLPHTATVKAMTEVDYYVIDNAVEILRTHPDWLLQIARLLAQRVNATTAMLTSKSQDESIILPQNFMSSWSDPAI
jgi:CRP/FNR family cyclic AMP-dependent transcriptional regulator